MYNFKDLFSMILWHGVATCDKDINKDGNISRQIKKKNYDGDDQILTSLTGWPS